MRKFFSSNILCGILLTLIIFVAYTCTPNIIEDIEIKFYDLRSHLYPQSAFTDDTVIVEVPDSDRAVMSTQIKKMFALLSEQSSQPKIITLNITPSDLQDSNEELDKELNLVAQKYNELLQAKKIKETDSGFISFLDSIRTSNESSDLSGISNIIIPVLFTVTIPTGKIKSEPEWLKAYSASNSVASGLTTDITEGTDLQVPDEQWVKHTKGAGHINVFPDNDGILRFEKPFIPYGNNFYPSAAITTFALQKNISPKDIVYIPGKEIIIGEKHIPLMQNSVIPVNYNTVPVTKYSLQDILDGKTAPEIFKDKTIILGVKNGEQYDSSSGKIGLSDFTATVIRTLLSDKLFSRPAWTYKTEIVLIFLAGIFTAVASCFKIKTANLGFLFFMFAMLAGGTYFFYFKSIWLKTTYPTAVLGFGYLFTLTKYFFKNFEFKHHNVEYSNVPPPPPVIKTPVKQIKNDEI